MVQLRPLTLLVLIVALPLGSSAVTAVVVSRHYERKIDRITEERQTYAALANSALGMSERAFIFARGYQETLNTCLEQLYRPTELELVATKQLKKGGLGGPSTVREQSRLP